VSAEEVARAGEARSVVPMRRAAAASHGLSIPVLVPESERGTAAMEAGEEEKGRRRGSGRRGDAGGSERLGTARRRFRRRRAEAREVDWRR